MKYDGLTSAIGLFAAICSTVSFLPQAALIWKNKSAAGVSYVTYAIFSTGCALWMAYALLIGSWPMVCTNTFALLVSAAIVYMKFSYEIR